MDVRNSYSKVLNVNLHVNRYHTIDLKLRFSIDRKGFELRVSVCLPQAIVDSLSRHLCTYDTDRQQVYERAG